MLKFTVEVRVLAPAPEDEEAKNIFMKNVEDIIQQGFETMTVPYWIATVVDVEEEDN